MKMRLLICGLLSASVCYAKNDLEKQHLKGRIKKLINYQYPVSLGVIDTPWSTVYVFRYDENGNQAEDEDYTGGSRNGLPGILNHRRVYAYDNNGNQVAVNEYNAGSLITQQVVYEYDANGLRTARKNYKPDGTLWRKSIFKYNDRRQETGCDKYAADSTLLQQMTYKYDSSGNRVLELMYVNHISDSAGNGKYFSADDSARVVRLDYMKEYLYDDSGRQVKEINSFYGSSFPFITVFKYEQYDDEGNWTRELYIQDGKVTNIMERVIEYY